VGAADIYVVNADGTNQTNLTNSLDYEWAATWSPDGTQIAFPNEGEIYVMDADGSGRMNLTNSPEFDHSPAWHQSSP
jgi:TolB protein